MLKPLCVEVESLNENQIPKRIPVAPRFVFTKLTTKYTDLLDIQCPIEAVKFTLEEAKLNIGVYDIMRYNFLSYLSKVLGLFQIARFDFLPPYHALKRDYQLKFKRLDDNLF